MVRISDILKQKGRLPEHKPSEEKEEKITPVPFQEELLKEKPQEYTEKVEEEPTEAIQVSKVMAEGEPEAEKEMQLVRAMRQTRLEPEESRRIYNHGSEVIKEILSKVESQSEFLDLREAYDVVKAMVDRIVLGDKELILLTVTSTEDNYLYAHSVNVCILSIDVGLCLGYNKSKLNELGLGALLHDLGMMKVMDIAKQPRILKENEYEEIKKHPVYSRDILSKIKDIQEGVVYIAEQTHERLDGKGYPKALKGTQMHEYAKIVAIMDVYEAMTHSRIYHKAMEPNEVVKELLSISSTGAFEVLIIKTLINKIGLYPVGCWVELNNGEIAKVSLANENSPLRPHVNIIFGADKERLPQIKSIDLTRHATIFIERSVIPKELNLKLE